MMFRPMHSIAALAALAAVAAVSPASAGSSCCCAMPCAAPAYAPMMVYEPYEMPQIYVVDRGPVYSGPGIYVNPTVVRPHRMPDYPYIGFGHPGYLPPYHEPSPLRTRAQAIAPRRAIKRSQRR